MEASNSSDLTIRPFKVSDADDFLIYAGDDKVTRLMPVETLKTKEEAQSFIEEHCIPHPYFRSICLNDHSVGYILIDPGMDNYRCKAVVSYMLAAKYWGQGIVTKALKIAVVEAFKELRNVVRMAAHVVHLLNKPSERVLEKVGFIKEGLMRKCVIFNGEVIDVLLFSLLSTDPIL